MKKAAFALSVNAIVILILGIVMLGLGVTFIRNMFGEVSTKIEGMIMDEPEPQVPSRSEPVTVSRGNIITSSGSTEVIKVNVFNSWGTGGGTTTTTTTTGTDFDCELIPEVTATLGASGDDLYISSTTQDDNVCTALVDTAGNIMCGYTGGAVPFCFKTASATGKTCTDLVASTTIATVGEVAAWASDANYARCEAFGCGPSDGTACTDAGSSTSTGTGMVGDAATPEVWCTDGIIQNNIDLSLQTYTKSIASGDSGSFNIVFSIGNVDSKIYLCQVRLREDFSFSKDFVIDVRRN